MPRSKWGIPKKKSQFICLKCLRSDGVSTDGIQRIHGQRKSGHIKDTWCCYCGDVKVLEVRYKDYYCDGMEKAKRLHDKLYPEPENAIATN